MYGQEPYAFKAATFQKRVGSVENPVDSGKVGKAANGHVLLVGSLDSESTHRTAGRANGDSHLGSVPRDRARWTSLSGLMSTRMLAIWLSAKPNA